MRVIISHLIFPSSHLSPSHPVFSPPLRSRHRFPPPSHHIHASSASSASSKEGKGCWEDAPECASHSCRTPFAPRSLNDSCICFRRWRCSGGFLYAVERAESRQARASHMSFDARYDRYDRGLSVSVSVLLREKRRRLLQRVDNLKLALALSCCGIEDICKSCSRAKPL